MDMKEFINDRYEAISSLDKNKIISFCNKYQITVPLDETEFWAGVHKALCSLYYSNETRITKAQYEASAKWLKAHGYSLFLNKK